MMAKIAHAYAIAEVGIDKFIPWLPDFILGKTPNGAGFVGTKEEVEPAEPGTLHRLEQRRITMDGRDYAFVKVRLFADMGAPEYWIIAGQYPSDAMYSNKRMAHCT